MSRHLHTIQDNSENNESWVNFQTLKMLIFDVCSPSIYHLIDLPGMGSLDVASASSTSCNNNSNTCGKYGSSVQQRAISKAFTPRLKYNK